MWSFWDQEPSSTEKKESWNRLDRMLDRLQSRLGHKPKPVKFKSDDLALLNKMVRGVLRSQPMLIEMEPPIRVVGDTHGQFYDLLRLFDFCGEPSTTRYVFLGDYVDRGQLALESLCLVLVLKVKYPDSCWLLRGNHECKQVNRIYGFYDEMKKRFGSRRGVEIWDDFCKTFNYLPVAALVGGRILCMHGGLSPDLDSLDKIRQLPRPCEIPEYGLMCDLMWSDPDTEDGWCDNQRGISFGFGNDQVRAARKRLGVDLIVRAHQMVKDGFKFSAGRSMVTIFSAPNYAPEVKNSAAVLKIDEDLSCSFEILRTDKRLPLIYVKEPDGKAKEKET